MRNRRGPIKRFRVHEGRGSYVSPRHSVRRPKTEVITSCGVAHTSESCVGTRIHRTHVLRGGGGGSTFRSFRRAQKAKGSGGIDLPSETFRVEPVIGRRRPRLCARRDTATRRVGPRSDPVRRTPPSGVACHGTVSRNRFTRRYDGSARRVRTPTVRRETRKRKKILSRRARRAFSRDERRDGYSADPRRTPG